MTNIINVILFYLFKFSVVGGAFYLIYLGYKLYMLGYTKGRGKIQFESKFGKFVSSCQGPGFLFMVFGALVLLFSLSTTHLSHTETSPEGYTVKTVQSNVPKYKPVSVVKKIDPNNTTDY